MNPGSLKKSHKDPRETQIRDFRNNFVKNSDKLINKFHGVILEGILMKMTKRYLKQPLQKILDSSEFLE